ncbi:MAG: hypothetical protein J0M12_03575 [Deltaproteobacteria bacterium]|nr:hypothetical protein [Deltaproteobacteria bacterium]
MNAIPAVQPSLARSNESDYPDGITQKLQNESFEKEFTVLVVNSSQDMAKEITLQLTLSIPGCSIMYAPSIELARWILSRRRVNLVVSSPLLPDGSIERLKSSLEKMAEPADLVVVGNLNARSANIFTDSSYQCTALRRINSVTPAAKPVGPIINRRAPASLKKDIQTLGADIRNDLNNPLQEIVAMVFVARTGADASPASGCALDAIEKAAKNMSKVVNALEDKIRDVVVTGS